MALLEAAGEATCEGGWEGGTVGEADTGSGAAPTDVGLDPDPDFDPDPDPDPKPEPVPEPEGESNAAGLVSIWGGMGTLPLAGGRAEGTRLANPKTARHFLLPPDDDDEAERGGVAELPGVEAGLYELGSAGCGEPGEVARCWYWCWCWCC